MMSMITVMNINEAIRMRLMMIDRRKKDYSIMFGFLE